MSVIEIDAVNEVSDPKLGFPNPSSQCSTCGAKDIKKCEGHYGVIKFPVTILHPYYTSEVVQILNKICPGCKSIRQDIRLKAANSTNKHHRPKGCKYCSGDPRVWYPTMKFKVSTNQDVFRKTAIIVEVNEKLPKKFRNRSLKDVLPSDFWDFIPKDVHQEGSYSTLNRRVLSYAQVHYLLKDVDLRFIEEFVSRTDSLFLNSFLVTPNCHRITEVTHAFSNGQRLMFDERTRAYRKLVDFRGMANELGSHVLECLKLSKVISEKSSTTDSSSNVSGLKWMKEVVLGKRTDHSFRMVVVGDPKIKLSEIGIPCHIAERLQISEHINRWNWEKLNVRCNLHLFEKGELFVRRKGSLIRVRSMDKVQMGDTIYRPLNDGDIVLINRPPSIHMHSLIALTVKVLPINSVVSINPLICSPFRGDFDGDCFHGYIPQSLDSRVELRELIALDKQLINRQSGRNLLSLSHDSLTAAHLVMDDGVKLSLFQMQQLAMFSNRQLESLDISKVPSLSARGWTGKQLFSMLLPPDFDYAFPLNGVHISKGDLISASCESTWLRETNDNLFCSLVKHNQDLVLDYLYAAQEVLCEWLSMRGLTVSLSDLYLSSDSYSRKNMIDEVHCGLLEAEQTCLFKQLLVDSNHDFLVEMGEENQNAMTLEVDQLCYEKQKSAALTQGSVYAFKQVFRDIQNLTYRYASWNNSLLAMVKAGSKGNLLKLVQQGLCLGLQHSLVPLSFSLPRQLSCAAWNNQKAFNCSQRTWGTQSYIPYAVVENSYITGLNPLETFVHSITGRESSFSNHAELPGTLTRKLNFFMRDLYITYDGTVRNAYGNQLVQFSYNIEKDTSSSSGMHGFSGENSYACGAMGGQSVGSLAACAISEASYSALDQPISLLEISPLLNLKNVLECGLPKSTADQTMSLFLSEKLGRQRHGFEYGALEVKNHLERLLFSDIVSTVMIIFSPQTCSQTHFSPWVCHFHVCKEILKRRKLKVHSIIDSLYTKCNMARVESKINLPTLQITSKECSMDEMQKENNDMICITVTFENSKNSCLQWETARDLVIPFFLGTVIRGFSVIKKVDILWNDRRGVQKSTGLFGELYLKVFMSADCSRTKIWNALVNNCIQIMDMIDWKRSHPDNINTMFAAYGIDIAWTFFVKNLKSAISDIGKTILPEHLLLFANHLSSTGEFVGLNAKGMANQKEQTSVSSPLMQACFSNPSACFIKAAKSAVVDNLQGSLDALAWGSTPSLGTAGPFELVYSEKGYELAKPLDVYSLLGSQISSQEQIVEFEIPNSCSRMLDKCGVKPLYTYGDSPLKGRKNYEIFLKAIRNYISLNDVQNLSRTWKNILRKYPVNHQLNDRDKSTLLVGLERHPRRDEKIGVGVQEIKVGYHPKHPTSTCFFVVRTDGTVEDFSYHKCVIGLLELIAPRKVKSYESKLQKMKQNNVREKKWDWAVDTQFPVSS